MSKMLSCTVIVFGFICIVSCKKSSSNESGGSGSLTGNWTFVSMTAHTEVDDIEKTPGDVYEAISVSDYTTTNNTGTVAISSNTMTTTGMSYKVNTTVRGAEYDNGQFLDSLPSQPFSFTLPSTSSTAAYQLIGKDSIYFPQGGFASVGTSGTMPSAPAGGKYTLNGNTLTLSMNLSVSQTVEQIPGDTVLQVDKATTTTTLQRQ